jgi:hypothetical protein
MKACLIVSALHGDVDDTPGLFPFFALLASLNCSAHHRMLLRGGISPLVILNFLSALVTDFVSAIHHVHTEFLDAILRETASWPLQSLR